MSTIEKLRELAMELTPINDPLDGDDTERLAEQFRIELDFQNGNITAKERDEQTYTAPLCQHQDILGY